MKRIAYCGLQKCLCPQFPDVFLIRIWICSSIAPYKLAFQENKHDITVSICLCFDNATSFYTCQVMKKNIDRVSQIISAFLDAGKFVGSCFNWDSPVRSVTAFIVSKIELTYKYLSDCEDNKYNSNNDNNKSYSFSCFCGYFSLV